MLISDIISHCAGFEPGVGHRDDGPGAALACGDRPPCARRASAGVCQHRSHIGRNECGELDRPCESGDLDSRGVEPPAPRVRTNQVSRCRSARHANPLGVDVPAVVEVSPLLRELIIHYTEQPDGTEEPRRRQRLLTVLIDQLAASSQQPIRLPAPHDPRLIEACKLVEENLSTTFDLEDLAQACRSSARTLARLFRDEMRMSYVQWRTQLRLYHALRMLADGAQVSTVAHRCGWSTASTFVDVFRRTYGHTPGGRQRAE